MTTNPEFIIVPSVNTPSYKMKIQLKQITSKLVFAIALGCLSQTVKAEPFHWNSFELKVKFSNVKSLVDLLEETFSSADMPFKITLTETVFSDRDSTHGLTVSSSDIDALSSLMSDENKEDKDMFMARLHELVEVKSRFAGVRLGGVNPPTQTAEKKSKGDIFAMWEMDVSDMEKYGAAWKELVSKTESVRENNIVGLGMYTFGRGKANAYVIHSFKSHSDMSKTLSAYGENEDFQKYQKEVKPLYTDINNTVYKVIKQW